MRARRPLAALVVAATAAVFGSESGWAAAREPVQVPAQPVVVLSSRLPRSHLFGDRIVAKLELAVNPALADPRSVHVETNFVPYRLVAPVDAESERRGPAVVLRYAYALQCVDVGCLPAALGESFRLGGATVRYTDRTGESRDDVSVTWPELSARSRLTSRDIAQPRFRARAPADSGGIAADLLGSIFAAAALVVLAGGAGLAWRLWPPAPAPALPARVEPEPTPLDGALRSLERAHPDDRRTQLDALSRSLERAGHATLAARARRLAWSQENPTPTAVRELTADIRREAPEAA